MRKVPLLSLLSLIVTASAVNAQSIATPIDSIVIVENRWQSPLANHNRNITIISSEEIRRMPVRSIAELLAYTAGIDVRQRGPWGAQADISIDGSTFDQVAVLLNGVKMSDPQTGHNMMNLPVSLTAIHHIEVIRGAASALYGVNALAGAINIVTIKPSANTVTAQVYSGSSFEKDTADGHLYAGWGAQATATLHSKQLAQLLSIGYDASSGYRYNTANKAYRLYYEGELKTSAKTSLAAAAGYVSNAFGASLFYAAPKDIEATEDVQTLTGSLSLTYRPSAPWKILGRASLRYNKDNYIYIRSNPEVYHNIHETNVATAEVQATKTLRHGHMGAGLEWREEAIHSNSLGQRSRRNAGAFAEYAVDITKMVSTGASVYINYNSDYGLKVYPALNAGYRINRAWKTFANAGISQRLPTYTDLYYKGPTNIGNVQLKPEEAVYAEGGIQYAHAATKLKGIYGYRHVTDFIDWVRADVQSPWQPQNFGIVNTQVLTISGEQGMDDLLGLPSGYQLSLHASWNYLVPDREGVDEMYSKYSTEALRHQAIAGMRATIASAFSLGINVRYQNRMNAGDYTLADVHLQYDQALWSIFADVTNIFNQAYTEIGTVPLPGRWLCIGLRIKSR